MEVLDVVDLCMPVITHSGAESDT